MEPLELSDKLVLVRCILNPLLDRLAHKLMGSTEDLSKFQISIKIPDDTIDLGDSRTRNTSRGIKTIRKRTRPNLKIQVIRALKTFCQERKLHISEKKMDAGAGALPDRLAIFFLDNRLRTLDVNRLEFIVEEV